MGRKFFYTKECPLPHECTPQNFKSWEPWGWTDETCRAQVLRHLRQSGKHKDNVPKGESRDVECDALVAEMVLSDDEYDDAPQVPKRRRTDAPPPPEPHPLQHMAHAVQQGRAFALLDSGVRGGSSSSAPVTRQDLREVSDALSRCVTSARHAQRLSAMAATAFNDEAAIFEEVKAFVDAKMAIIND